LTGKIDASAYFILNNVCLNYQAALTDLEDGKCDMILEIPASFDKDLMKEQSSSVFISANAVDGIRGSLGSSYLTHIVADFSADLRKELAARQVSVVLKQLPQIEPVSQYRFNPMLDYKRYILPAFMVIIVTLICGILPAVNIVSEKEAGTINQINVTPVNKWEFILAKIIPYWIIGFILMAISVLVAYIVYGFWPAGNVILVLLVAIVFIFSISGMGIIISNYSNTLQQASFLVMFFILISVLLSGMFTPVSSMPYWAQLIAFANPLTYFTRALRMVYLNGSTLSDIVGDLAALLGFALLLNSWAVISYRKRG
jgi:ABC-2 type transport system permease protein